MTGTPSQVECMEEVSGGRCMLNPAQGRARVVVVRQPRFGSSFVCRFEVDSLVHAPIRALSSPHVPGTETRIF